MAQLPQKPTNIFEVINENVNVTNQNVLTLIEKATTLEQEVIALTLMFKAPEEPNDVPGRYGAKKE